MNPLNPKDFVNPVKPQLSYLSNGMQMCLHANTFAPVVSVQIWVKTGSIDELPPEFGMAHVLEHMVFKGTKGYPAPGQIASLVESHGGELNAYTTFDHTVYHITAPKDFLNVAVDVLWDMAFFAQFEPLEVSRELEVVREEIRRGRDNPGSLLSHGMFKLMFDHTPLGRPVIGFEEVVQTFTSDAIREFYNRWYVPNNMMFIASGDFDAPALAQNLAQRCHTIRPRNLPPRMRPPLPMASVTPGVWLHQGPFQEARLQIATRAPTLNDPQCAPWEMFTSLLGGGDSSRLVRIIRDEKQWATYVGASTYSPAYPAGLFCMSLFAQKNMAPLALAECIHTLGELALNGPAPEELRRVLSAVQASRLYAQESVDGLSRTHGQSLLTDLGLRYDESFVEQLEAVTCEDVQHISQKVLESFANGDFCAAGVVAQDFSSHTAQQLGEWVKSTAESQIYIKNLNKKSLTEDLAPKTTETNSSNLNKSKQKITRIVSDKNPEVQSLKIPLPGQRVLHLNIRKSNRLPITSFTFYSQVGSTYEDLGGLGALTADLLTRGTQRHSQRQFLEELDNLSSNMGGTSTKDFFGLRADCLKAHLPRTLELFFDALLRPAFLPQELRKAVRETQETLMAQKDSPGVQLSKKAAQMLFADHPYSQPSSGTPESLEKATVELIENHWKKVFSRKTFIMSVAGDFDEEPFVECVLREFTEFFEGSQEDFSFALPPLPKPSFPREPQVAFLPLEREQAHILLTFRGYDLGNPKRTALELATQILSGQSGRLFLDLRDVKSLAYSVGAQQSPQLLAGSFSCYMGTQAAKAAEALGGLKHHIEQLATHAPSPEEHRRAQNALLGSQSIDVQHVHYQATQLAMSDLLGLGFDHFLNFQQRVMAVTAEDVSAALKELLCTHPPLLVIMGPQGTWQPQAPLGWFKHTS